MPTPQTPFPTAPMPSKQISPSANTSNLLFNCPHALNTYFTECQHLTPPFQLLPCPQKIFHPVPTPQTPFSTAPMPSIHISPSANPWNPLFNCPHALKTHFPQWQHLKPTFQLPSCPQNIFHTVLTPQTPFPTHPMPSKHISSNANTSIPFFNCPHALKTYFTKCQHLTHPYQLPPCRQNTLHPMPTPRTPFELTPCPENPFHPMPTRQTPFSTAPMPKKRISPTSANTTNPFFNSPHALKTHFTQCQHLKPPFQLPPCPQNTFHPVSTPRTSSSTAPMPSEHISHSTNTSNPLFNSPHALRTYFAQCQHLEPPFQMTPCPQNTFHPMPTPQTPFSTAFMPSKHISHSANTSNPFFNSPHALKTHCTQCQHLKPPFQLPACPQNTFHPVPTPHPPFSTAPMPSRHISPTSGNTSNPLFNRPHALKTYFTQCQHLKPPYQLPPCPQNTFHPVPTPQTPFPTAPMPSKHSSPTSGNTSNPLFNPPHAPKTHFTQCQHLKTPFRLPPCPRKPISPNDNTPNALTNSPNALKTYFTQCQHLKTPLPLPPCPQSIFDPMPTSETPISTAPMPSKHLSPNANTSNPLFNSPHDLKTYFTQCQHLKAPFQLLSSPQNTFHQVQTPHTPFSTAPMPSNHISPWANTSSPLLNCPHALKTHFTHQWQHLTPPFQPPPCPHNIFHPVPTPQTPFSTPPRALKTHFTRCQHLKPPFQLPPCLQNIFHPVPTPQTPFPTPPMPSKHISPSANTSISLLNCPHALKT